MSLLTEVDSARNVGLNAVMAAAAKPTDPSPVILRTPTKTPHMSNAPSTVFKKRNAHISDISELPNIISKGVANK
jgi:hypothetical protein